MTLRQKQRTLQKLLEICAVVYWRETSGSRLQAYGHVVCQCARPPAVVLAGRNATGSLHRTLLYLRRKRIKLRAASTGTIDAPKKAGSESL
jgi:hypothetical protein